MTSLFPENNTSISLLMPLTKWLICSFICAPSENSKAFTPSYNFQNLTFSKTSILLTTSFVTPFMLTAFFSRSKSNQFVCLGLPVVAPNSCPASLISSNIGSIPWNFYLCLVTGLVPEY